MSFLGKEYKLERQENFEEFLNALPIPEDFKKGVLQFKPTTKLEKDGDTYTFTTTRPDDTTSVSKFKSGVQFENKIMDYNVKTTITIDGNTVTEEQKFDNEDKTVFTFTKEFTDKELVVTIKTNIWDGVSKRYYKAV